MTAKKQPKKKIKPIIVPRSFTSKKYPDFIRKSIFLKAYSKPEKVFPRIGLKNCEAGLETVKIDSKELIIDKISDLITDVRNRKNMAENTLGYAHVTVVDMRNLINILYAWNDTNPEASLTKINGKFQLLVPPHLRLTTVKTTGNTKLIDVLKHFDATEAVKTLNSFDKIDDINAASLLKKKNLKVCFSSSGNRGYWDIATMSMRKIKSCMRWGSSHCTSLVGSILDPYAGIVYLTDGTNTKYGKSMLARAVVRFVVDNGNYKPSILIENIYTSNERSYDEGKVEKIFKSFISSKVKMNVIVSNDDTDVYRLSIPFSEPTKAIEEIQGYDNDRNYLSYRDSDIEYSSMKKFFDPRKVRV